MTFIFLHTCSIADFRVFKKAKYPTGVVILSSDFIYNACYRCAYKQNGASAPYSLNNFLHILQFLARGVPQECILSPIIFPLYLILIRLSVQKETA